MILRCPFTGKESASWQGIEGWRCGNDVCHVGPYKTEQAAIEAWNQRWVPPIVWKMIEKSHQASAGSRIVGMVLNGHDGFWTFIEDEECGPYSEEEAKAKVEQKWREAYLEMHR